jgi:hypothetical protein
MEGEIAGAFPGTKLSIPLPISLLGLPERHASE